MLCTSSLQLLCLDRSAGVSICGSFLGSWSLVRALLLLFCGWSSTHSCARHAVCKRAVRVYVCSRVRVGGPSFFFLVSSFFRFHYVFLLMSVDNGAVVRSLTRATSSFPRKHDISQAIAGGDSISLWRIRVAFLVREPSCSESQRPPSPARLASVWGEQEQKWYAAASGTTADRAAGFQAGRTSQVSLALSMKAPQPKRATSFFQPPSLMAESGTAIRLPVLVCAHRKLEGVDCREWARWICGSVGSET